MFVSFSLVCSFSFFFNDTATTEIYTYLHTLSLHDALPIYTTLPCEITGRYGSGRVFLRPATQGTGLIARSEEHTSELQSLMRISYAVFCLKKKRQPTQTQDDME